MRHDFQLIEDGDDAVHAGGDFRRPLGDDFRHGQTVQNDLAVVAFDNQKTQWQAFLFPETKDDSVDQHLVVQQLLALFIPFPCHDGLHGAQKERRQRLKRQRVRLHDHIIAVRGIPVFIVMEETESRAVPIALVDHFLSHLHGAAFPFHDVLQTGLLGSDQLDAKAVRDSREQEIGAASHDQLVVLMDFKKKNIAKRVQIMVWFASE